MAGVTDTSRRGFLFGRLRAAVAAVQPDEPVTPPAIAEGTGPEPEVSPAVAQIARIGEDCLALQQVVCRTCGEMCEPGAIRFVMQPGRVALPEILPERCTGCGDCIADCPTLALVLVPCPAVPSATGSAQTATDQAATLFTNIHESRESHADCQSDPEDHAGTR